MTRNRALIYGILQKDPGHYTAEEIFALAREQSPRIARGTVYRNLTLMERDHQLSRVELDGAVRFDRTVRSHGHLLCDACGSLTDLPVIGLMREVETAIGTEVRSYQLVIHYVCAACRAKDAAQLPAEAPLPAEPPAEEP